MAEQDDLQAFLKPSKRMERTTSHKPRNYWKKWENVAAELKKIIDEHGCLPSSGLLRDLGYSRIIDALQTYHGGFPTVRKRLQEEGRLMSEQ